jgi:membrane protein DedA with SNARE-associated domain
VAALPALWIAFVVLRIVVGTALDPTSHNLWPFEILMASVASLVLIGLMALTKRWQRKDP